MPKGVICPTCNTPFRPRAGGTFVVCNCSTRRDGHALYPTCQLEPSSVWRSCLCEEIDEADVPCVACEAIAVSAEGCRKCGDILTHRVIEYAARRVGAKAP